MERSARFRIMFTTQLLFPCVIFTLPAGTAANPAGTRRAEGVIVPFLILYMSLCLPGISYTTLLPCIIEPRVFGGGGNAAFLNADLFFFFFFEGGGFIRQNAPITC